MELKNTKLTNKNKLVLKLIIKTVVNRHED